MPYTQKHQAAGASVHPRRQRAYPQPPPLSKNNTTRTINTVSILKPHFVKRSWTGLCNDHLTSLILEIIELDKTDVWSHSITLRCVKTKSRTSR